MYKYVDYIYIYIYICIYVRSNDNLRDWFEATEIDGDDYGCCRTTMKTVEASCPLSSSRLKPS